MKLTDKINLASALHDFKSATTTLLNIWQHLDGDEIKKYPKYLPSFEEFHYHVQQMEIVGDTPVTFEDFQASRTFTFGMRTKYGTESDCGYVYEGNCYIERRTNIPPSAEPWYLILERSEYASNNLSELEEILYGWYLNEICGIDGEWNEKTGKFTPAE